jgi:alkylated DNA repair protein (DNA oxidative demethylase)
MGDTAVDDLFAAQHRETRTHLGEQACVLHGFALDVADRLLDEIRAIETSAPFRQLVTPGGHVMQVAMTNAGTFGWCSDRRGYRYDRLDPQTGQAWPALPPAFLQLAADAARDAGFDGYVPDACLINRYAAGSRLTPHRDADEQNFAQPIVSVSMGLPASFAFYGLTRGGKGRSVALTDGDVLVWGGPSRLVYHAVRPLKPGHHPLTGDCRYNLTFRHAR